MSPTAFIDPERIADEIIARVGRHIRLGLPLGLGKANHIANALYARAEADRSLSLTIFTALTLEPPRPKSDLERRFMGPVIARTLGGYPALAYGEASREGRLPPNIEVNEFFFQAGARLRSPSAQQAYISANYTHATRYVLERGVNVLAPLVAARGEGAGRRFSLSCNTDTALEMLCARAEGRADFIVAAETNAELPFMLGEADLPASDFELVLDGCDFPLFAPPRAPIEPRHYAIGFHVASLIPDGGTLQLGIGSTADAICQALIVRHREPALFAETLQRLSPGGFGTLARHTEPFRQGLYACTEMFVDGFLQLYRAGVLSREVDGALLHGGFFVGPRDFYQALREMPDTERARFAMTDIGFTNALYGEEAKKRAGRVGARFANTAFMATLLGDVVSDQLEDGRLVSGVGGQYDFVAQAFALGQDARSIITLNATRREGGRLASTLRWAYGHTTLPRHLRDVVVTEYGVADLRGRTDAAVIAAMLALADARFAPVLAAKARAAGKLARTFVLPGHVAANTAGHLDARLAPARAAGLAPAFPFGTDLDAGERALLPALGLLAAAQADPRRLAGLILRGRRPGAACVQPLLARLGLAHPVTLNEKITAAVVRGALLATADRAP